MDINEAAIEAEKRRMEQMATEKERRSDVYDEPIEPNYGASAAIGQCVPGGVQYDYLNSPEAQYCRTMEMARETLNQRANTLSLTIASFGQNVGVQSTEAVLARAAAFRKFAETGEV